MENINQIEQLLNEVQTISGSYERVAEATGENFNLFSILQMESDEVGTHSRFIAELLNPQGRHGQKDVFLKKFLENFEIEESKTQDAKVFVEYHIGQITKDFESGGRIDILVRNIDPVIMIENKIYAREQHKQLNRYHKAFPTGVLFYLTLYGEMSNDKSLKENIYKTISYETDIINWLEECRKESANIPILRESISQYINLIKKLTNQSLNTKMSQEIINRVLRDEDSVQSYIDLYEVRRGLVISLFDMIIPKIKVKLEKQGFIKIKTMVAAKTKNDYKGILISFQNEVLEKNNLSIKLNFEGRSYADLILGFHNENNIKKEDQELYKLFLNQFSNRSKKSINYPAYILYDDEYKNWGVKTLGKIHFHFDDFYNDLYDNKLKPMLEIVDLRFSMNK